MRTVHFGLWTSLALLALGCSGGGKGPAAPSPSPSGPIDLSSTMLPGGDDLPGTIGESVFGTYTVALDLKSLSGTITPIRQGAENDELTHLAIDAFLKPDSITLTSVSQSASTVDLDYVFEHPFDPPINLTTPTAANRADLAASLRILVLADLPTGALPADYTFFGGEAIANTDLIANADGFYQPRGLLNATGTTTNTFPYKMVVDESNGTGGNRLEASNSGNVKGNYRDTDGTGWQATNIDNAGVNNGWTGYDVLFQGQSATGRLRINNAAIASGDVFSFNIAIVGKYDDPRRGATKAERQSNRLPKTPVDTREFLFRQPFGAIDASVVRSLAESGGLIANNTGSTTTVSVNVRDWDAFAQPSAQSDLKLETDGTRVLAGTEGLPTVTVDIPGVTTAPVSLTEQGATTGAADDPLLYEGLVTNLGGVSGLQVDGTLMRGLYRIEDPENSLVRDYEFHLQPDLSLLTSNQPEIVTYQALNVAIGTVGNGVPSSTVEILGGVDPLIGSGASITFQTTSESDLENDAISYDIDVTTDATYESLGYDPGSAPPPAVPIHSVALTVEANTGGTELTRSARVRYSDPAHAGSPIVVDLPYRIAPVGANLPPTATVSLSSTTPPSGGTLTFNLDAENDPEGDTVTYGIDYNYTGVYSADVTGLDPTAPPFPTTLNVSPPQVNPGATPLARTARVQFTDGVNLPLNIDLPYQLGPAGACSGQTLAFTFDAGMDNWYYETPNDDGNQWGWFSRTCTGSVSQAVTAMGGGLAGGFFTSGEDHFGTPACAWMNDHGGSADYNIISPYITIPAICTPNSLQVIFNAYLHSRTASSSANLYVSTDFGGTWGTPVWTATGNVPAGVPTPAQLFNNQAVTLPDTLAGQTILLKMNFRDTSTSTFSLPGSSNGDGNSVGLTFDNIRIAVGASSPPTASPTPPPLPCAPRNRTFDFSAAQGWVGGQGAPTILPNGDRGGTAGGWGSFRWTDCSPASVTSGTTYQAVLTASGGAISGTSLNVSADGTGSGCGSYLRDYGYTPTYNVVSPRVAAPAVCSGGTLALSFQAYLNTDDGNYQDPTFEPTEDGHDMTVQVRAYVSTDNGATWGAPVWSSTYVAGGMAFNPTPFDLTPYAGNPNGIRVRFEFTSTAAIDQSDDPNDPFGFYVDNVLLTATNTTGLWVTF